MLFFRYYVRMRRNLRQFITILVLLMGTLKAVADDFTLKGKVVDEEEHALELVTVSCPAQGKVTMTNLKGEFSLHLQSADSIEVRFSMVGFATRKRVFRNPKKQLRVQIVMHPMKALQEVTVTQQRRQTGQTQELNVKDLKQTPSTTGNAVEELIQQQAGVSTHNELSSQYNVRGGSFDENLVYINQVEVYRPMLRWIRSKIWRQNVISTRHHLSPCRRVRSHSLSLFVRCQRLPRCRQQAFLHAAWPQI